MPGPMSTPNGNRSARQPGKGQPRTPRTGKTDVKNNGAIRQAVLDEQERFKQQRNADRMAQVAEAAKRGAA